MHRGTFSTNRLARSSLLMLNQMAIAVDIEMSGGLLFLVNVFIYACFSYTSQVI